MAVIPLPDTLITSNVSIDYNIPNFASESLNLVERVAPRGLHRAEGTVDFALEDGIPSQKAWQAFIMQMQGRYNTVNLQLSGVNASEDLTQNPTTLTVIAVGNTSFTVGSLAGGESILAGSPFNFPNDTKIHYALNTATTGEVLNFYPAARVGEAIGQTILFQQPTIHARFTEDTQTVDWGDGLVVEVSMNWREAL